MSNEKLEMYRNISKYAIDILDDIYSEIGRSEFINYSTENKNTISEYTLNRVCKLFTSINKEMNDVDFTEFTEDELYKFGFNKWDDNGLMLAPKWVFNIMKKGTILTSINGDTKIFGKDEIDMDSRYGSTAYGLTKVDLRDGKIKNVLD